jgi:hypothetical protein
MGAIIARPRKANSAFAPSRPEGGTLKKRVSAILAAALCLTLLTAMGSGASASPRPTGHLTGREFFDRYGYLPLRGVARLDAAKAFAEKWVAAHPATGPDRLFPNGINAPAATIGSSWQGVSESDLAPLDPNGAIGPNSYVEIINTKMGIYNRNGTTIATGSLSNFGTGSLSDPTVLWDVHTQRFYFNVWDTNSAQMVWGFSKSSSPNAVTTGAWCTYKTAFGYASSNAPDYPKLGQTKDFLLIGVNFYPSFSSTQSTSSDLLWLAKPQGSGTITTCPAAPNSGKFTGLTNSDSTQAFTPEPAIQIDPSSTGYVLGMSDIEGTSNPCNNNGNKLTVFTITNNGGVPAVSAPDSITVTGYTTPPSADQKGTTNKLDTLDGRVTRAVAAVDPRFGTTTVWVSHPVAGGSGSMVAWYEVNPTAGTIAQTGTLGTAKADILNSAISPDRACTLTSCAFGDSMVLGATASGPTIFPADVMVSKIGAGSMSPGTLVHISATNDHDFSCSPCRWGDYGGASPDPAANQSASHGEVWLTNQYTNGGSILTGGDLSWNWEAKL